MTKVEKLQRATRREQNPEVRSRRTDVRKPSLPISAFRHLFQHTRSRSGRQVQDATARSRSLFQIAYYQQGARISSLWSRSSAPGLNIFT